MSHSIPPAAKEMFESLCGDVSDSELSSLRERVRTHVETITDASNRNELLPVDIAEALADSLRQLLQEASNFSSDARALVAGAARYFVSEHDHIKDTSGILGLDDDVAVFNYVVREIGRDNLTLEM